MFERISSASKSSSGYPLQPSSRSQWRRRNGTSTSLAPAPSRIGPNGPAAEDGGNVLNPAEWKRRYRWRKYRPRSPHQRRLRRKREKQFGPQQSPRNQPRRRSLITVQQGKTWWRFRQPRSAPIFQRLGRRQSPPRRRRSPNRFPDLRECPTRGALFGGLRHVPRDGRDPPRGACFNCRQGGHTRFNCREPPSLFSYNCGRRGTTLRACPRYGEAHLEYVREQGRATRHDVWSRSSGRSSEPRSNRRYPPTHHLHHLPTIGAWGRKKATRVRAPPRQPSKPALRFHHRRRKRGEGRPRQAPWRDPSAPRLVLTKYFTSIQYLLGALQETLLQAS